MRRVARLSQAHHDRRRPRQRARRSTSTKGEVPAGREARRARRARACSSASAAAPPRRWAAARRVPSSISRPCSAATRRCSAARRRSSTAAGRSAPRIRSLAIHDVGAGGLSNARARARRRTAGCGARDRPARDSERRARHVARWSSGATSRRSATCCTIDAGRRRRFRRDRASASAARTPSSASIDDERAGSCATSAASAARPSTCRMEVLFGKPPKMTRDARRVTAPHGRAFDARAARRRPMRSTRVLRFRPWPTRRFLVTIGDRTVGGLIGARSDGGPVAGARGRRRRHRGGLRRLTRRSDGDG